MGSCSSTSNGDEFNADMKLGPDEWKIITQWAGGEGSEPPTEAELKYLNAIHMSPEQEAELKKAFASFDANGNGTIDMEELKEFLRRRTSGKVSPMASAVFTQIWNAFDTDDVRV